MYAVTYYPTVIREIKKMKETSKTSRKALTDEGSSYSSFSRLLEDMMDNTHSINHQQMKTKYSHTRSSNSYSHIQSPINYLHI